jgi:hypothetical protein
MAFKELSFDIMHICNIYMYICMYVFRYVEYSFHKLQCFTRIYWFCGLHPSFLIRNTRQHDVSDLLVI